MFDIWLFTAIARADELSGKDLEGLRTSLSVSKGQKIDQNNSRSGVKENGLIILGHVSYLNYFDTLQTTIHFYDKILYDYGFSNLIGNKNPNLGLN